MEKLVCISLTPSLVSRYITTSVSMVFLDVWTSVLGCGYNQVDIYGSGRGKNQNLDSPAASQLGNCACNLQHSEEPRAGDLNHRTVLVAEKIF